MQMYFDHVVVYFAPVGGVDFEKRALSLSITSPTPFSYIPIISDSVWEGIESFTYNVVASSKSYNRTIFILDKNGWLIYEQCDTCCTYLYTHKCMSVIVCRHTLSSKEKVHYNEPFLLMTVV